MSKTRAELGIIVLEILMQNINADEKKELLTDALENSYEEGHSDGYAECEEVMGDG